MYSSEHCIDCLSLSIHCPTPGVCPRWAAVGIAAHHNFLTLIILWLFKFISPAPPWFVGTLLFLHSFSSDWCWYCFPTPTTASMHWSFATKHHQVALRQTTTLLSCHRSRFEKSSAVPILNFFFVFSFLLQFPIVWFPVYYIYIETSFWTVSDDHGDKGECLENVSLCPPWSLSLWQFLFKPCDCSGPIFHYLLKL